MAENKDDSSVFLYDVLADDDELREAMGVLAGSDPENCSYSQVRRARFLQVLLAWLSERE